MRHDAPARLVAAHAAPIRGQPNRSRDVAAQLEHREARGERGGRPTRRPAGGARGVPRVVGGSEDRVVGLPVGSEGRCVGLAEDHRTRFTQPLHGLGIPLGHVVPCRDAAGGAHACRLVGVLDRHRHAVQRAQDFSPRHRRVRGIRRAARAVGVKCHNGIQRWVQPFDARQVVIEQLPARELTTPNRLRQFMSGLQRKLGHDGGLISICANRRIVPQSPGVSWPFASVRAENHHADESEAGGRGPPQPAGGSGSARWRRRARRDRLGRRRQELHQSRRDVRPWRRCGTRQRLTELFLGHLTQKSALEHAGPVHVDVPAQPLATAGVRVLLTRRHVELLALPGCRGLQILLNPVRVVEHIQIRRRTRARRPAPREPDSGPARWSGSGRRRRARRALRARRERRSAPAHQVRWDSTVLRAPAPWVRAGAAAPEVRVPVPAAVLQAEAAKRRSPTGRPPLQR